MYLIRHFCPILMADFLDIFFLVGGDQTWNFMKIRLVETEVFRADGQMDRHDEADSRFSLFSESAYNHIPQLCSRNKVIRGSRGITSYVLSFDTRCK
jgi:hypothetical protein